MNAAIARTISLGITRVFDVLRAKAASSVAIRALLIGALAVSVTIGGVIAGALVVAPVVARATRPDAVQQTSQVVASVSSVVRTVLDRTRSGARRVLTQMPAPISRFAVPGLAMLSIFSAMVALLMRRQPPSITVALATTDVGALQRPTARQTPRGSGRTSSSHSKTPRAVEALAASGASAPDIAWRTGLPLDAVQLLLAISTGARQLQPPTA